MQEKDTLQALADRTVDVTPWLVPPSDSTVWDNHWNKCRTREGRYAPSSIRVDYKPEASFVLE